MSTYSNQQCQSPSSLISISQSDSQDIYDLKTEFYTREGLWKLIPSSEYQRQPQSIYNQQQQSQQQLHQTGVQNHSGNGQNHSLNPGINGANLLMCTNEPVKLISFRYFRFDQVISARNMARFRNLCLKCAQKKSMTKYVVKTKIKQENNKVYFNSMREHDDDEDVVYSGMSGGESSESDNETFLDSVEKNLDNFNLNSNNGQFFCKYCNGRVIRSNEINSLIVNFYSDGMLANTPCLDLVLFNYAREIYFFEANDLKIKKNLDADSSKTLLDKKAYRTFMSTCFDLNLNASMLNTIDLQVRPPSTSIDLSPTHLSLILAAGFNKGEIHIFDGFHKEASVFYNNNRLVDKSKVTCIKWIPGSVNLFLAGHASGCLYLYDATNQAQPSVAPVYTKLYQDKSFAIYLNPNSAASVNIIADKLAESQSRPANNSSCSNKLILSLSNQVQTTVARNPLLKWCIGASETTSPEGVSSFTNINSAGVNGVNDIQFSPCGSYLAIVSQDGYLRLFSFAYQSNQQLHIQMIGSMKSYFGGLLCCVWSPDGRYVATGGEDDLITMFSVGEMRVACRGRGHNSWINAVVFDTWTDLESCEVSEPVRKAKLKKKLQDKDQPSVDSDLEESQKTPIIESSHHLKPVTETPSQLSSKTSKNFRAKKNRTISTLSDFTYSNLDQNTPGSVYYRLASCGQDNQIAFWDLTEDVLKEKHSQQSRSRLTSLNHTSPPVQVHTDLPQIILQPSELKNLNTGLIDIGKKASVSNGSHSSLVSTARNLFSLKHLEPGKNKSNLNSGDTTSTTSTSSSSSSFFSKKKRNSSLNHCDPKKTNNKTPQVTINSYTKKNPAFDSVTTKNQTPLFATRSSTEVNNSIQNSPTDSFDHKNNLNSNTRASNNLQQKPNMFNICPKLDEVPVIEPLICKRICRERITDIKFKEQGLLVATQDGYVFTWSRPDKCRDTCYPCFSQKNSSNMD